MVSSHVCVRAQSCPTLCESMECSPPGSSVHEIFPGKNTGVGCYFFLQEIFWTQGSNLCPLHQLANSLPLSHLARPHHTVNVLNCMLKNS